MISFSISDNIGQTTDNNLKSETSFDMFFVMITIGKDTAFATLSKEIQYTQNFSISKQTLDPIPFPISSFMSLVWFYLHNRHDNAIDPDSSIHTTSTSPSRSPDSLVV